VALGAKPKSAGLSAGCFQQREQLAVVWPFPLARAIHI
jgi:hypothetical protein